MSDSEKFLLFFNLYLSTFFKLSIHIKNILYFLILVKGQARLLALSAAHAFHAE